MSKMPHKRLIVEERVLVQDLLLDLGRPHPGDHLGVRQPGELGHKGAVACRRMFFENVPLRCNNDAPISLQKLLLLR